MKSLMAANSVLECLTILFEENIFSEADVGFIQFLCKETNCEELHNKCEEYARGQEIHFFKEGICFDILILILIRQLFIVLSRHTTYSLIYAQYRLDTILQKVNPN